MPTKSLGNKKRKVYQLADGKIYSYNAIEHKYFIEGIHVPSVTQIIGKNPSLDMVPDDVLEKAREEGVKNHYEIQMLLKHGKAVSDYAKKIDRFLATYMKGWDIELFEEPLFHNDLMFGGTPDLVMRKKNELALLDWKRSLSGNDLYYKLQFGGYSLLLDKIPKQYRLVIGQEVKTKDVYDPLACNQFTVLLSAYNIRKRLGQE